MTDPQTSEVRGMRAGIIPLTQGRVALVDPEDYEWLNQWKWTYIKCGKSEYAYRMTGGRKNRQRIYMHRLINHTPPGTETDHIDGDGLNNQRGNLRLCNHAQNAMNRPLQSNNTSGYRGVYSGRQDGQWRVIIQVNRKQISIGQFADISDAARAYNEASLKFFGEFARFNNV